MATETVTPVLNVVRERSTYCLVETENDKGEKEIKFSTESAALKAQEKNEGKIIATQSFLVPAAASAAGIEELVASEKERVKLFNRGVDQKAYGHIRATLLETNDAGEYIFQPVEGDKDLTEFIGTESAARATSVESKMEKLVDGMDATSAAALLAKLMAKISNVPEAAPVA
jgi:hypothetical protein